MFDIHLLIAMFESRRLSQMNGFLRFFGESIEVHTLVPPVLKIAYESIWVQ